MTTPPVKQGGLLAFARTPVPREPQGPYRSGATSLKVFCWIAFIWTLLLAGIFLIVGIAMLIFGSLFGAMFDAFFQEFMPMWGGAMGAAVGALMFFFMLIATVVVLAVGLGVVAWAGWIYVRWVERDDRALGHALTLGIIMTVIGGLNVLMTGGAGLMDPSTLAMLVFGILFIVFASNQQVKETFQASAPGAGADAAPPV